MPVFEERKRKVLQSLSVPEESYTDASPKGSVDEGIRELVDEINTQDGFVTTSSCAGRIAVYLEGPAKSAVTQTAEEAEAGNSSTQTSGGKGGGKWLFVSHEPIDLNALTSDGDLASRLGLPREEEPTFPDADSSNRFIHLKFEPMILHVMTRDLTHGQMVLSAGLTAGMRESGISSISSTDGITMVAVRSAGLAFDCIVASADESDRIKPMVSESYLHTIVRVANQRFSVNAERKERFRRALLGSTADSVNLEGNKKDGWEPTEQRRERKRAEGLRRREEVKHQTRQPVDESLVTLENTNEASIPLFD